MRNFFWTVCLAFGVYATYAQQETLFKIGDEVVTVDEFKNIYLKNKDVGKGIDPKTPEEYLDLYINFKLKVQEARTRGLDTLQRFKREFGNYRNQLAAPYLSDKSMDTLLVKEAYARLKEEVKASHIMLDLSGDAPAEDTLKTYNELLAIRNQILKGEISFEEAAKAHSTDRGTAVRGGELGYFTAFAMVYPFESAAYNTKVGDISLPVRTQFGYHLVKVQERRPASGRVRVAHILVKSSDNDEPEDQMAAQKKIREVHHRIKMGDDFGMTAKQYSDDRASAQNGGELEPFGINTMMIEFEEAAFALQYPGAFSAPIKTNIGYHVIKLLERYPVGTFEEMEAELFRRVSRDTRSLRGREALIARLQNEYNFKEQPKALKEMEKVVNQSYLEGTWTPEKYANMKKELFSFDGQKFTQADFVNYLANQQFVGKKYGDPRVELNRQYKNFVESTIIKNEDQSLERKYPAFRYLVNEYRDGILLFDLTEELIWNRAITDTVGVTAFYEANQNNYMWDERIDATIYKCQDAKTAKAVRKMVNKGLDKKTILERANKKSELSLQVESGIYSRGRNTLIDGIDWQPGLSPNIDNDGSVVFVAIHRILPPQPKKMEEARGLITSDYQRFLEQQWVSELRQKYPVTINQAVLQSVVRELE
jgi:peptidyl-prolyl cis-trans isomerase SurA